MGQTGRLPRFYKADGSLRRHFAVRYIITGTPGRDLRVAFARGVALSMLGRPRFSRTTSMCEDPAQILAMVPFGASETSLPSPWLLSRTTAAE